MHRGFHLWKLFLLGLLALTFSGCLGNAGNQNGGTGSNGGQVNVVQNVFKGKIFVTSGHNLYVITGDGQARLLVSGGNIYDPAVSPDGSKIAFVQKYKQYSNLAYLTIRDNKVHILLSGNGKFFPNSAGFIHNTYYWFFEPAWSSDGSKLLILSDWMKLDYVKRCPGGDDADLLDLQVFAVSFKNPTDIQAVAYADFGGGGDRDPSYRPTHMDQIVYTHYSRLPSDDSNQVVQLFLADPGELARHPELYCDGGHDSGIAISNPKDQVLQPAFSPDGKTLAYVKRDHASQMSLHVMPVPENVTKQPDNPNMQKQALLPYQKSQLLETGLSMGRPVWSPDGKQIAYIVGGNGNLDLWVVNLKQNAQTGTYAALGTPAQVTAIAGGIDGNSRVVWTN